MTVLHAMVYPLAAVSLTAGPLVAISRRRTRRRNRLRWAYGTQRTQRAAHARTTPPRSRAATPRPRVTVAMYFTATAGLAAFDCVSTWLYLPDYPALAALFMIATGALASLAVTEWTALHTNRTHRPENP